jgi:hypothetical protein
MEVILSTTEQMWLGWAEGFVKHLPNSRRLVKMPTNSSMVAAKTIIIDAIKKAEKGGSLIISVGHGSALDNATVDGTVEIAPGGTFKLAGLNSRDYVAGRVSVFYDFRADPAQPSDLENDLKNNPTSDRLKQWAIYKEICAQFKSTELAKVTLLTCRVGNTTDMIRKIASDWNTIVAAYKVRVAAMSDTYSFPGKPPVTSYYCGFEGEVYPKSSAGNGADQNIRAQQELPRDPQKQVLIGPPLPTP